MTSVDRCSLHRGGQRASSRCRRVVRPGAAPCAACNGRRNANGAVAIHADASSGSVSMVVGRRSLPRRATGVIALPPCSAPRGRLHALPVTVAVIVGRRQQRRATPRLGRAEEASLAQHIAAAPCPRFARVTKSADRPAARAGPFLGRVTDKRALLRGRFCEIITRQKSFFVALKSGTHRWTKIARKHSQPH